MIKAIELLQEIQALLEQADINIPEEEREPEIKDYEHPLYKGMKEYAERIELHIANVLPEYEGYLPDKGTTQLLMELWMLTHRGRLLIWNDPKLDDRLEAGSERIYAFFQERGFHMTTCERCADINLTIDDPFTENEED